jgi:electron transfer flavoprotein alpha subunit
LTVAEPGVAHGVLVIAEAAGTKLTGLTGELLGLAQRLTEGLGGPVSAALIGHGVAGLARELGTGGAARIYVADHAALAGYEPELWVAQVARIAEAANPAAVLIPHTTQGADLGPRLAFRLDTVLATGCVALEHDGGRLLCTRPCYGGGARETLWLKARPAVATVRGGVGSAAGRNEGDSPQVIPVTVDPGAARSRLKVVDRERPADPESRLEDARVVIAGGRGLEGPEGFEVLAGLARSLGGAVGASRVPCDLGWCPHSMQIGLTGRTVTPELYIAVGISGAGHHMAGCGNARNIVAINTDPEAAIYREARWGVVGDYREVIPPLIEAILKLRTAREPGAADT